MYCFSKIIENFQVLTFGTNISNMLRKQQKMMARDTKTNEASCCEAYDGEKNKKEKFNDRAIESSLCQMRHSQ